MLEPRTATAYVHDHSYPPFSINADSTALVVGWADAAPRTVLTELMLMYRLEGAAQLEARAEWP